MRTTVDLPAPLLQNAKQLADERHTTLSSVVQDALREHLTGRTVKSGTAFQLHTVRGRLVHPEVDLDRTSALLMEDDEAQFRKEI